jgi:acyl-CoA synthetase (AMP-forming)/AMP-acid ligase II
VLGGSPTTPDAIALRDAFREYTWADIDDIVNRGVNALRGTDLGPERRVAVVGANAGETILAHLMASLAGVSSVPVNPRLTAAELRYIVEDSRAGLVFCGPEADAAVREAVAGTPVSVVAWRTDEPTWDAWLASAPTDEPPSDHQVALALFYTSGTTGFPKATFSRPPGTLTTVADYVASLDPLADEAFGPARRTVLVVAPVHHVGGFGAPLSALLLGIDVVLEPRFDAARALRLIDMHKVGSTVMVPTHFVRLLALPDDERARYDVGSLEVVGHTGAGCPVAVKQAMIDWWGPVLLEAYGATEAGQVCVIDSREWLEHPGSVGRCLPSFRAVVVDDDGAELAPGEVGRLYFEDTTGAGIEYRNAPDKTSAAHLRPGVFTLGDMGYVDADGYVFVTDRAIDLVISGGANVYPAEAEHVLLAHPGVRDVAVIGVPHPDLGETPLALVEPADATSPPPVDELLAWCRARLAHYKCPTGVEFVDTVNRSPMGKLDKRALRAPYWPTDRTIAG